MSGHSKWSTIKRQKGANDQARGKLFTKLASNISIAVREGGNADPDHNIRLRFAIEKAKTVNMPKENIARAIDRGAGKGKDALQLTEVVYEGFAPGGIAILAVGVTDNRQRTISQVKNIFNVSGGNLGSTGSVSYLFQKIGAIELGQGNRVLDDLIATGMELGALDFAQEGESFYLYTPVEKLHSSVEQLQQKGWSVVEHEIIYKPTTEVALSEAADYDKVLHLTQELEALDDIHNAYTNLIYTS